MRHSEGTCCTTCGRRWTSPREAHCAVCHRHFTSYAPFDIHLLTSRDGETVEHREPATVTTRDGRAKLVQVERSSGPTWATAGERPAYWQAGRGAA